MVLMVIDDYSIVGIGMVDVVGSIGIDYNSDSGSYSRCLY